MTALFVVLFLLPFIIIAVCNSSFDSRDKARVINEKTLRREAKIIGITSKAVGSKNNKRLETCVTFDDGFCFCAYDTERKDGFGYYKISVTEEARKDIVTRATEAHEAACGAAGVMKPFVCGNCGHQGPYLGNCPNCGSSLKRYIN